MKKQLFWIVPIVLYIFYLITDATTPYFNRFWFNAKHVLLFGLIIYVLLINLYFVYRFFIKRYQKITVKLPLIAVLSVIAVLATITVSNYQMKLITQYEIPYIDKCKYYDVFGNVIYQNIVEACPELEEITQTHEQLSFVVNENYQGKVTEPLIVENGTGYISYLSNVDIRSEVNIHYVGSYISSIEYSVYTTNNKIDTETNEHSRTTRYMYQEKMSMDLSIDNEVTVTYRIKSLDVDANEDTFPSFDTIDEQIKRYKSTLVFDEETKDLSHLTFEEITYDESSNEIIKMYAVSKYIDVNYPLFSIDFYDNNLMNGVMTDFAFPYGEVQIYNGVQTPKYAGVERSNEDRRILFQETTGYFVDEDTDDIYIEGDVFTLASFDNDLDGNLSWADSYSFTNKFLTIDGELFQKKSNGFYSKFVFTDYGLRVEEYKKDDFTWSELLSDGEGDKIPVFAYIFFREHQIRGIMRVYDYKETMEAPGRLTSYHLYQHNHLIEFMFIDNYEKYDDLK